MSPCLCPHAPLHPFSPCFPSRLAVILGWICAGLGVLVAKVVPKRLSLSPLLEPEEEIGDPFGLGGEHLMLGGIFSFFPPHSCAQVVPKPDTHNPPQRQRCSFSSQIALLHQGPGGTPWHCCSPCTLWAGGSMEPAGWGGYVLLGRGATGGGTEGMLMCLWSLLCPPNHGKRSLGVALGGRERGSGRRRMWPWSSAILNYISSWDF